MSKLDDKLKNAKKSDWLIGGYTDKQRAKIKRKAARYVKWCLFKLKLKEVLGHERD